MSAEVAATLWSAVDAQRSFLTAALPRFAGKTTTTEALLALRPPDVPLHRVDGHPAVMTQLEAERRGGYLVVAEFSRAPVPGYIWGEPVRRVFATATKGGYSLQAALHAHDVDEAVRAVTWGNGIDDAQASIIGLVIYIELFGTSWSDLHRRVAEVYEVDRIENGRPVGRTLFRWRPEDDTFSMVEPPAGFGRNGDLSTRTELLTGLAASRADGAALQDALVRYRTG
jgi:hypothetical protein